MYSFAWDEKFKNPIAAGHHRYASSNPHPRRRCPTWRREPYTSRSLPADPRSGCRLQALGHQHRKVIHHCGMFGNGASREIRVAVRLRARRRHCGPPAVGTFVELASTRENRAKRSTGSRARILRRPRLCGRIFLVSRAGDRKARRGDAAEGLAGRDIFWRKEQRRRAPKIRARRLLNEWYPTGLRQKFRRRCQTQRAPEGSDTESVPLTLSSRWPLEKRLAGDSLREGHRSGPSLVSGRPKRITILRMMTKRITIRTS